MFFKFLKSIRVSLLVEAVDEPERTLTLRDTLITFRGFLKVQTTLPDDKVLPFVAPTGGVDAKGNPTKLSGKVVVTVSDDKVLKLVQPDPTTPDVAESGTIEAVGPVGTAQVKFEDDGDGAPLVAIIDVEVIAGATVSLAAPTFGALRDPGTGSGTGTAFGDGTGNPLAPGNGPAPAAGTV